MGEESTVVASSLKGKAAAEAARNIQVYTTITLSFYYCSKDMYCREVTTGELRVLSLDAGAVGQVSYTTVPIWLRKRR